MKLKLNWPLQIVKENVISRLNNKNIFFKENELSELGSFFGRKRIIYYDTATKKGQGKAYEESAVVQSIIDQKVGFAASGVFEITKNGKPITVGYEYNILKKLIHNPNPLQTWREFEANIIAWLHVYGFAPIYKVFPANRSNGLPSALWVIDPETFDYELTGKQFDQTDYRGIIKFVKFKNFSGYETKLEGDQLNNLWIINGKTLKHGKDSYTNESPLVSLKDQLNLFQIGVNAYGQLIKQSILGIISNRSKDVAGGITLGTTEKDELNEHYRNSYGVIEGKNNFIITSRDLFFQSMLTNVGNLQIPSGLKEAINSICDKLSFRPELLSLKDATFENKKTAEIAQYQDDIIPMVNHIYESLTTFIATDGMMIRKSFDHLEILQENKKEEAETLQINISNYSKMFSDGLITYNEYLVGVGQKPVDGMDKYVSELQKIPAATRLGVGGTQALQNILIDQQLSRDQKINIMVFIFGIPQEEATQIMGNEQRTTTQN